MTTATDPEAMEDRQTVTAASAPIDFVFPKSYSDVVVSDLDDIDPLMWLLERREFVTRWTRILKGQFPDRVLVPFAKDQDSDDVYCFDGNDRSGNPPVLLIHSFTTPGWEYRGEWNDFDSWYRRAQEHHALWLENPDDFGRTLVL